MNKFNVREKSNVYKYLLKVFINLTFVYKEINNCKFLNKIFTSIFYMRVNLIKKKKNSCYVNY